MWHVISHLDYSGNTMECMNTFEVTSLVWCVYDRYKIWIFHDLTTSPDEVPIVPIL